MKENNSKKEQRNGKIHLNFEMGFKYISRKITLKYWDQWSFPSLVGYEVYKKTKGVRLGGKDGTRVKGQERKKKTGEQGMRQMKHTIILQIFLLRIFFLLAKYHNTNKVFWEDNHYEVRSRYKHHSRSHAC